MYSTPRRFMKTLILLSVYSLEFKTNLKVEVYDIQFIEEYFSPKKKKFVEEYLIQNLKKYSNT